MLEYMPYKFRSLERSDIAEMHQTFIGAFSDYKLPFQLSYEQFVQKFILKLSIDFSLSVGAFSDNKLVGFIFTSIGPYQNKRTAYNGGTGVLPSCRGKGLTQQMYEYLLPRLRENDIKQAVLEVLVENQQAIRSYLSCGFSISTTYHCFQFSNPHFLIGSATPDVEITLETEADWDLFTTFHDAELHFLDSSPILKKHIREEQLVVARMGEKVVGYIIFQPQVARISQLAVDKRFRKNGIGKQLLMHAIKATFSNTLTIVNVDYQQIKLINILKHMGFEHTVDQYEMKRDV